MEVDIPTLRQRLAETTGRLNERKEAKRPHALSAAAGNADAQATIAEIDGEITALTREAETLALALEEAEKQANAAKAEQDRQRAEQERKKHDDARRAFERSPEGQLPAATGRLNRAESKLRNADETLRVEHAKRNEIAKRVRDVEGAIKTTPEGSPDREAFEAKRDSLNSELQWREGRVKDAQTRADQARTEFNSARENHDRLKAQADTLRKARAA